MKSKVRSLLPLCVAILFAWTFAGCSGDENEPRTGTLKINLTDAPLDAGDINGVYITFLQVEVNGPNGWQIVSSKKRTFNLLDFQSGLSTTLSEAQLQPGTYNEIRLLLDVAEEGKEKGNERCFIRFKDHTSVGLFVPSGQQTGYKVKGEFEIKAGEETGVTIDFDVRKSVHSAGSSGKYVLKPVVRLVLDNNVGTVNGNYTDVALYERVMVFAYKADTYSSDEINETIDIPYFAHSVNGSVVDADGNFTLAFLPPGTYDFYVVAFFSDGILNGVIGQQAGIQVNASEVITVDF